jgi:hypothetical protein
LHHDPQILADCFWTTNIHDSAGNLTGVDAVKFHGAWPLIPCWCHHHIFTSCRVQTPEAPGPRDRSPSTIEVGEKSEFAVGHKDFLNYFSVAKFSQAPFRRFWAEVMALGDSFSLPAMAAGFKIPRTSRQRDL